MNFNPPSLCREGPRHAEAVSLDKHISIHPLYAERDDRTRRYTTEIADFNPPSLCREGRLQIALGFHHCYFNPPSLCREGQQSPVLLLIHYDFNPPSLCREGPLDAQASTESRIFQSTLSMQRGTQRLVTFGGIDGISIHPLYAERDHWSGTTLCI